MDLKPTNGALTVWCWEGGGVMIDKTTYNMGIIIITLVHMFYSCCRGKVLVQFHLGKMTGTYSRILSCFPTNFSANQPQPS